jgi:16S rRNA (guanine(966)-N(2))-methyltransferase RsmD
VRVIAGSARGRRLKSPARSPEGAPAIRPTSDLIRGVIFNMLDAMGASYDRVLDLYAGTGALGIEALSRGEGTADFVESDGVAARLIEANLRLTGFSGRATIHRMAAATAVSRLRGPYTLVLADPPYYDTDAFAAASAVAGSRLVRPDTIVVVEHRRGVDPPAQLGILPLYRSRRHGSTVVSIYAQEEAP